jgi:hypothetical protein
MLRERFLKAYDIAKEVLRDPGVLPRKNSTAGELRPLRFRSVPLP